MGEALLCADSNLNRSMTAAFIAAANLTIRFPGESAPDSKSQYEQVVAGQLDDCIRRSCA
jgi:hypothetical protein